MLVLSVLQVINLAPTLPLSLQWLVWRPLQLSRVNIATWKQRLFGHCIDA